MKFSEWKKLWENDLARTSSFPPENGDGKTTQVSNQRAVVNNHPDNFRDTGVRAKRYRTPTGSPGVPHSDPIIRQSIQKLTDLSNEVRKVSQEILSTEQFERTPKYKEAFLQHIRAAVDGMTRAQTLLHNDQNYQSPELRGN